MKSFFKWLAIILIFVIFIMIYARYIGTLGFITKEYSITDKNIPEDFDGIKIVHFSDLHYNRAISLNKVKKIVDEINDIHPDIVVFTGDLIDKDVELSDEDINKLINILKKIDSKIMKYAIMGNHDYAYNILKVTNIYESSNFKYLDNEYDVIYSNNNKSIMIGGISSITYNLDDTKKVLDNSDNFDYKIILLHEPDITDKIVKDYKVNLILAGHSHNGQIRLPLIGAIYTPPYAEKYYDEYYVVDNTKLYISSGIGVSTFNYRLNNRPSINFYRVYND